MIPSSRLLASALLFLPFWLLPTFATAGPLDERAALAHIDAIAAGDVDAVMAAYGDEPFMDWVGGTLDGRYRGKEAIREVWTKFMANNDKQPRTVQRTVVEQAANPKGATLATTIDYIGKTTVRVRHVLVYRDTRLVTELWQIAPAAPLVPASP